MLSWPWVLLIAYLVFGAGMGFMGSVHESENGKRTVVLILIWAVVGSAITLYAVTEATFKTVHDLVKQ